MADYAGEIKENKAEIKHIKGKIEAAEANRPMIQDDKDNIARWSQEIKQLEVKNEQLEVKNEQLKLENEIKELKMKAEKEKNQDSARDLRAEIKNKGKLLDETREGHLKLLGKSPASVDHATAALEALVLNQKEPHVNRVIALITSKHKPRTDNHFIPSNFSNKWPSISFAIDGKSVLETHRPPEPNTPSGHRHVSLTSEALGKLYAKFYITGESIKVSDLQPEDYELAQQISEVAVGNYKDEAARRDSSRDFLKKLSPDGADSHHSSQGVGNFNQTTTDHTFAIHVNTLERQIPIAIIEFKVEMGVAGDPIMESIAYHVTHAVDEVILENTRVPCLLITISGPVVVIYCGAWTGAVFHYDYLASIVTHPSCYKSYFVSQALFWRNIKDGLKDLAKEVKANEKRQLGFPYPRSFKEGDNTVNFKYRTQVDEKDCVFMADEEGGEERMFVVKFCQTYSQEVHQLLAEKDLAPKLYGIEKVAGGWLMVVMEEIQGAVQWDRDTHAKEKALDEQVQQVLTTLSPGQGQQHVHGDLRFPNVLVKGKKVYIIDFEWAGEVGKACFPGSINRVFFNVGGKAGGLITQEIDTKMAQFLLTGRY